MEKSVAAGDPKEKKDQLDDDLEDLDNKEVDIEGHAGDAEKKKKKKKKKSKITGKF